jgi:arginine deiminase
VAGAEDRDADHSHRVDSEVGRLRTVLLHRPGAELKRLTPRNRDDLLFDDIPWVDRAQSEHDTFAASLRDRDVEVLYLQDLLVEAIDMDDARPAGERRARGLLIDAAVHLSSVGPVLDPEIRAYLQQLSSKELAHVVVAGMTLDEAPSHDGFVSRMLGGNDFVVAPLPNLLFTRDSSVWIHDDVAVTRLAMPARRRESTVTQVVYENHSRFAGVHELYGGNERAGAWLEGGDVLLLSRGVLAVGVGQRTTPAGVETFAHSVFARQVAHTVLAVPITQERATMHLDTVCTMVDIDAVVMYPAIAQSLEAYTLTSDGNGAIRVDGPTPFLDAAARAMGIARLRVIDTGLDPVTAEREQWDDGNNTLAIAPGVVVAYERNTETNARLEDAGIEVVRIPGSELGSGRGGPRCMSCPLRRDDIT